VERRRVLADKCIWGIGWERDQKRGEILGPNVLLTVKRVSENRRRRVASVKPSNTGMEPTAQKTRRGSCHGRSAEMTMNYETIREKYDWIKFSNQIDKNVTYVFVLNRAVARLSGASDILYIGKTEQAIAKRYEQETRTNNTSRNTQQTNIRMTHVFQRLGIQNVKCYYTKTLSQALSGDERARFLRECGTWDKKFCIQLEDREADPSLEVPLEKYLLVCYAAEHLEVPPMNNRM